MYSLNDPEKRNTKYHDSEKNYLHLYVLESCNHENMNEWLWSMFKVWPDFTNPT